ncbi:MAG: bifunctional nicotinamidase/pyrazinamidase [Minwuia sp.]|nr:bifunctional nicotinamidase/pyrazinamidase [Minwuia sp.]
MARLDPARDLLLLIDIQNDFCPGGALAVADGDAVVPLANRLSDRFSHVALTQDWHPAGHASFASSHPGAEPFSTIPASHGPQTLWPDHCVQGTVGAAFHAGLNIDRAEIITRKGCRPTLDSYSAFFENDGATPTGLAGYVRDRGLGHVVMAGLATDFCVAWSALDARRLGLDVSVMLPACRAIDQDGSLAAAIADMTDAGIALLDDIA